MFEILDILFPKKCIYCHKYGSYICDNCFKLIKNELVFKRIYNDYFDYMICGFRYKGKVKEQLHDFKFHEKAYYYEYFIECILKNKKVVDFLKQFDIITYIPMSYNKEIQRGYNQAELLANCLGDKLRIKVKSFLEKNADVATQSTLSEVDRIKNVQNAFYLKNEIDIKNKKIIVVDDILTTGSTVRFASKILKENNSGKICVFAIAKT